MGHSPGSPALSSPLVARHRLPRNHRLVAHSGSRLDQVVLRPAAALRRPIPPNCLCPHCPGPKPATVSLQKRITTETQSGEAAKELTTETPRHREEADQADSSWGEKTFELSSAEKKRNRKRKTMKPRLLLTRRSRGNETYFFSAEPTLEVRVSLRRLLRGILSGFLGLAFASQSAPAAEPPADLVVFNGKIVTMNPRSSIVQAVAIRDGRFVAVGGNTEVKKWIGDRTRVIDARRKTVVPGLIETHVHALGVARTEAVQPFVQLSSIAEIQQWVREQARTNPKAEWIQIPRIDLTRLREGRLPTRPELDAAVAEHPVVFNWQYGSRQ